MYVQYTHSNRLITTVFWTIQDIFDDRDGQSLHCGVYGDLTSHTVWRHQMVMEQFEMIMMTQLLHPQPTPSKNTRASLPMLGVTCYVVILLFEVIK